MQTVKVSSRSTTPDTTATRPSHRLDQGSEFLQLKLSSTCRRDQTRVARAHPPAHVALNLRRRSVMRRSQIPRHPHELVTRDRHSPEQRGHIEPEPSSLPFRQSPRRLSLRDGVAREQHLQKVPILRPQLRPQPPRQPPRQSPPRKPLDHNHRRPSHFQRRRVLLPLRTQLQLPLPSPPAEHAAGHALDLGGGAGVALEPQPPQPARPPQDATVSPQPRVHPQNRAEMRR